MLKVPHYYNTLSIWHNQASSSYKSSIALWCSCDLSTAQITNLIVSEDQIILRLVPLKVTDFVNSNVISWDSIWIAQYLKNHFGDHFRHSNLFSWLFLTCSKRHQVTFLVSSLSLLVTWHMVAFWLGFGGKTTLQSLENETMKGSG